MWGERVVTEARVLWQDAAMRMGVYLLMLLFVLSGCAKTSAEVAQDMWRDWQAMDELVQQDYPDAVPIILVHGWNGDEFTWPDPERLQALEKSLQRDIYFFTYRTGWIASRVPPLELLEEQLERYLSGFKRVDVVAHSMGGLLVRQYLSHHAEQPMRRVVFLSTPHFGTNAASILAELASVSAVGNVQAQETQPGSNLLWHLNSMGGTELSDVEVLNAYAMEGSLLEGDTIVLPSSAWLPGQSNVAVAGDHHVLARSFDQFTFIVNFLRDGIKPESSPMPKRHDIWLRVLDANGQPVRLTRASLDRSASNKLKNMGIEVCCSEASSLMDEGRKTMLINDVQPDERLLVRLRDGTPALPVSPQAAYASGQPVLLLEVQASASDVGMP